MVGKKQLTLSLMRQFIQEDIIDHDNLALKGVPWDILITFGEMIKINPIQTIFT